MYMHKVVTAAEIDLGLNATMTIALRSAKTERLCLDVTRDLTLSDYAIVISKFSERRGVSRKAMKYFVLPRVDVLQGDKVTIHTGSGRYELQEIPELRVHHIYLGERKPLYRSSRRALSLIHIHSRLDYSPMGRDALPNG